MRKYERERRDRWKELREEGREQIRGIVIGIDRCRRSRNEQIRIYRSSDRSSLFLIYAYSYS